LFVVILINNYHHGHAYIHPNPLNYDQKLEIKDNDLNIMHELMYKGEKMELLWFEIVIVLTISDILHSKLMWNAFNDFYVIFAGFVNEIVSSPLQGWIIHEVLEAIFNMVLLSIIFLSLNVGILAGLIHFCIDISHSLFIKTKNPIVHRSLHFAIESIFFILIYGL
jgi:hypothetical protein